MSREQLSRLSFFLSIENYTAKKMNFELHFTEVPEKEFITKYSRTIAVSFSQVRNFQNTIL